MAVSHIISIECSADTNANQPVLSRERLSKEIQFAVQTVAYRSSGKPATATTEIETKAKAGKIMREDNQERISRALVNVRDYCNQFPQTVYAATYQMHSGDFDKLRYVLEQQDRFICSKVVDNGRGPEFVITGVAE